MNAMAGTNEPEINMIPSRNDGFCCCILIRFPKLSRVDAWKALKALIDGTGDVAYALSRSGLDKLLDPVDALYQGPVGRLMSMNDSYLGDDKGEYKACWKNLDAIVFLCVDGALGLIQSAEKEMKGIGGGLDLTNIDDPIYCDFAPVLSGSKSQGSVRPKDVCFTLPGEKDDSNCGTFLVVREYEFRPKQLSQMRQNFEKIKEAHRSRMNVEGSPSSKILRRSLGIKKKAAVEGSSDFSGLLFISYQKDIAATFEVLHGWANERRRNDGNIERDPIIGQDPENPSDLVKVLGGEYFFVPPKNWEPTLKTEAAS
jgi:hypothetical protein